MAKRQSAEETSETKRNMVPVMPATNLLLNEACDRLRVSKTKLVGRLVDFFAAAPESMQAMIIAGAAPVDVRKQVLANAITYVEAIAASESPAVTRDRSGHK